MERQGNYGIILRRSPKKLLKPYCPNYGKYFYKKFKKIMVQDLLVTANQLYAQEKFLEAIDAYEKAIAENPSNVAAYYWLGWSYSKIERNESAEITFEKFLSLSPDSEASEHARKWLKWKKGIPQVIGQEADTLSCKQCGAPNPKTNKFCGQCSVNLTSEPAPIASSKPEKAVDVPTSHLKTQKTETVSINPRKSNKVFSSILLLLLFCALSAATWYVFKPTLYSLGITTKQSENSSKTGLSKVFGKSEGPKQVFAKMLKAASENDNETFLDCLDLQYVLMSPDIPEDKLRSAILQENPQHIPAEKFREEVMRSALENPQLQSRFRATLSVYQMYLNLFEWLQGASVLYEENVGNDAESNLKTLTIEEIKEGSHVQFLFFKKGNMWKFRGQQ